MPCSRIKSSVAVTSAGAASPGAGSSLLLVALPLPLGDVRHAFSKTPAPASEMPAISCLLFESKVFSNLCDLRMAFDITPLTTLD